ncbi:helix-turn-helix domain-containing protein [Serratia marcescens]|uniref:helix-turn-helix domain-containing protein n=1 Tax=Serratia marcescens TaxID=615 RepID=UPI00117F97DF|nr:helix-turn-helix domain-containing protein [Serratia marcescens]TSB27350.1 helix-turn-helix domain-containing protein [Serratia marcescens]TXE39723.1 helix-turn-helix domain-containing protein [Serratia marcescens]
MDNITFDNLCRSAIGENYVTELSEALGVTDRTVRNWRSGNRSIPDALEVELLSYLNDKKERIEHAKRKLASSMQSVDESHLFMHPETKRIESIQFWRHQLKASIGTDAELAEREIFSSLIPVVPKPGVKVNAMPFLSEGDVAEIQCEEDRFQGLFSQGTLSPLKPGTKVYVFDSVTGDKCDAIVVKRCPYPDHSIVIERKHSTGSLFQLVKDRHVIQAD